VLFCRSLLTLFPNWPCGSCGVYPPIAGSGALPNLQLIVFFVLHEGYAWLFVFAEDLENLQGLQFFFSCAIVWHMSVCTGGATMKDRSHVSCLLSLVSCLIVCVQAVQHLL
jgi:hypothetical protein